MRGRSKSLHTRNEKPTESFTSDEDDEKSIDMCYSDLSDKEDIEDVGYKTWSSGDNVTLLRKVWQQIPKKDNIPYDKRLEEIDWCLVAFDEHDQVDVKRHFEDLLSKVRTFRLLDEIVKDVEKVALCKLNLPNKPVPAMALFMQENKEEVKKYMATSGVTRFARAVANLFNTLPDEQKSHYKKRSLELRKKYNEVISIYNLEKIKKKTPAKNKIREKKLKTKEVDAPLGIYIKNRTSDNTVSVKEAKEEYAKLSRDDKLIWILRWVGVQKGEKLNLEQHLRVQQNCSREEIQICDDYEERPKLLSAYNLYLKDYFSNFETSVDRTHRQEFQAAAASWKCLSEEKRTEYNKFANMSKASYMANCMRFITSLPKDRQEYEIKVLSSKNKGEKKNILNNSRNSLTLLKANPQELQDDSDNDTTLKRNDNLNVSNNSSNDEEFETVFKINRRNDSTLNCVRRRRITSETEGNQISPHKAKATNKDQDLNNQSAKQGKFLRGTNSNNEGKKRARQSSESNISSEEEESILNTLTRSKASFQERKSDYDINETPNKNNYTFSSSSSSEEEFETVFKINSAKKKDTSNVDKEKGIIKKNDSQIDSNYHEDKYKNNKSMFQPPDIKQEILSQTENNQTPLKNTQSQSKDKHVNSKDIKFKLPAMKPSKFKDDLPTKETPNKQKKRIRESSESLGEDSVNESENDKKRVKPTSIREISINSTQSMPTKETPKKQKKRTRETSDSLGEHIIKQSEDDKKRVKTTSITEIPINSTQSMATKETPKKQKRRTRQSSDSLGEHSINESEDNKKRVKTTSITEISIDSTQSEKKKKNKNKDPSEEQKNVDLTREFLDLAKQKPPETIEEYYAKFIYDGPKKRASKAYKLLNKSEKEKILKVYEKLKKKYQKNFQSFAGPLSKEQFYEISEKCKSNLIQDEDSDEFV